MTEAVREAAYTKLAEDLKAAVPTLDFGFLEVAAQDLDDELHGARRATSVLASIVTANNEDSVSALSILAEATKKSDFWRTEFGVKSRLLDDEHVIQLSCSGNPDCVLESARRIVDSSSQDTSPDQLTGALRVITNCCANNNLNRALIVRRSVFPIPQMCFSQAILLRRPNFTIAKRH